MFVVCAPPGLEKLARKFIAGCVLSLRVVCTVNVTRQTTGMHKYVYRYLGAGSLHVLLNTGQFPLQATTLIGECESVGSKSER